MTYAVVGENDGILDGSKLGVTDGLVMISLQSIQSNSCRWIVFVLQLVARYRPREWTVQVGTFPDGI